MRALPTVVLAIPLVALLVACNSDSASEPEPSATLEVTSSINGDQQSGRHSDRTRLPDPMEEVESCVNVVGDHDTADALVDCLAESGIEAATKSVEGPSSPVLLAIPVGMHTGEAYHYIVWTDDDIRRVQDLTPQLPRGNGYQLVPDSLPTEARLSEDGQLLALTMGIMMYGSGARESMMLLAKEENSWSVAWDGGLDGGGYELAHSDPEFVGDGVDEIQMTVSSWQMDDPKRDIFHESNSGPHRWFNQRWIIHGEEYVLESEEVMPSGYNTLVEFMYALKTGDSDKAASLTTNDALVQVAEEAGLVQGPDEQEWYGWCQGDNTGTEPPCRVELPSGYHVRISMTPDGDDWLISDIEPPEFPPS